MDEQTTAPDWPGSCFGCAPSNPYGLKLHFRATENGCTANYTVPSHLCGMEGFAHGGIVALLLDEAGGWCLIRQLGRVGLTEGFNIEYLKPIRVEEEIIVTGTLSEQLGNSVVVIASAHSVDNVCLARSTSRWKLLRNANVAKLMGIPPAEMQAFFDGAIARPNL